MSWHQHTHPSHFNCFESETSPQLFHLVPQSFAADVLFPLNAFALLSLLITNKYVRLHGHECVAIRRQSYSLFNVDYCLFAVNTCETRISYRSNVVNTTR